MQKRISGAILAGGQGKRMGGSRKGLLQRDPRQTMVDYLIQEIGQAGIEEIVVVSCDIRAYSAFGRTVIPDIRPNLGPLGGIEAALAHAARHGNSDAVLFLPCDMPAISRIQIQTLLDTFQSSSERVVVATLQTENIPMQPLCSIVHKEILPSVQSALDEREYSVRRLWKKLGAHQVAFHKREPFLNVNRPQDYTLWKTKETSMTVRLSVPETLRAKIEAFGQEHGITIEFVDRDASDLRVTLSDERRECTDKTLESGGWIECSTALALAERLPLPARQFGALLDRLDIKIRACSLGCFQ